MKVHIVKSLTNGQPYALCGNLAVYFEDSKEKVIERGIKKACSKCLIKETTFIQLTPFINQVYGYVNNSGFSGLERSEILKKCNISINLFNLIKRQIINKSIFYENGRYYTKGHLPAVTSET